MTEGHTPDLIERVEAATENDPDLFWEAHYAVNPKPETIWRDEDREVWTAEYAAYIAVGHRFGELIDARAFLDAAVALIPDFWTLFHVGGPFSDSPCHATVGGGRLTSLCEGRATTPALAIISASLKARAIP